MIRTYLLFWLVLAIVAVSNGILRVATYGKAMSDLAAHQLSTLTGIIFISLAAWLFARRHPVRSRRNAIIIGIAWVGMTVAFEFVFGRFVAGHPWHKLLQDYNLLAGRVWSIFLIALLILPLMLVRTNKT